MRGFSKAGQGEPAPNLVPSPTWVGGPFSGVYITDGVFQFDLRYPDFSLRMGYLGELIWRHLILPSNPPKKMEEECYAYSWSVYGTYTYT
jgi:hypothetical protein